MSSYAIQLNDLDLRIENRLVLENISINIEPQKLIVVFGPNGAGKTSLLRVLLGQLKPTRGEVLIFGEPVEQGRLQIGYVPQHVLGRRDFPITVEKAVMLGRLSKIGLFRRPQRSDFEACDEALLNVGLEALAQKPLSDLSGGQRQRVFLARALAGEPRILLLDEATSGVDAGAKENLYDLLVRLKEQLTVVFVTHDMSVVSRAVDVVMCLNRTLVSHGRPEQALSDEALACMYGDRTSLFTHCNVSHVHVHKHE